MYYSGDRNSSVVLINQWESGPSNLNSTSYDSELTNLADLPRPSSISYYASRFKSSMSNALRFDVGHVVDRIKRDHFTAQCAVDPLLPTSQPIQQRNLHSAPTPSVNQPPTQIVPYHQPLSPSYSLGSPMPEHNYNISNTVNIGMTREDDELFGEFIEMSLVEPNPPVPISTENSLLYALQQQRQQCQYLPPLSPAESSSSNPSPASIVSNLADATVRTRPCILNLLK